MSLKMADCRGKVKTNAFVLFCSLFAQPRMLASIQWDSAAKTTTTFFIILKNWFLYQPLRVF